MSAVSREAYLATGLDVLAELGFGGLKLAELCARLGVTTGSFYHYFSSWSSYTRELVEHWRQASTTRLIEQIRAIPTHGVASTTSSMSDCTCLTAPKQRSGRGAAPTPTCTPCRPTSTDNATRSHASRQWRYCTMNAGPSCSRTGRYICWSDANRRHCPKTRLGWNGSSASYSVHLMPAVSVQRQISHTQVLSTKSIIVFATRTGSSIIGTCPTPGMSLNSAAGTAASIGAP